MTRTKVLDEIGKRRPIVLQTVRELAAEGKSVDAISQELARRHRVTVGRMAVDRWLKDNPLDSAEVQS